MRILLLLLLAACALPHVDPRSRTDLDAVRATVRVDVDCSTDAFDEHVQWSSATGTGVLISERHVLTAAHVVRCSDIPNVTVTTYDGRRFRMFVERDDDMFGSGKDLARLKMASGSTFRRFIAPPKLEEGDGMYTIALRWNAHRGTKRNLADVQHKGDSGAGVYGETGGLVGLLLGTDENGISIVRVDETWLAGT